MYIQVPVKTLIKMTTKEFLKDINSQGQKTRARAAVVILLINFGRKRLHTWEVTRKSRGSFWRERKRQQADTAQEHQQAWGLGAPGISD